jgi:hypothetical protein
MKISLKQAKDLLVDETIIVVENGVISEIKVAEPVEEVIEVEITKEIEKNFQNAVGQDSLTRFDKPKGKSNKNKKRRKPATINKNNAPKKE